MRFSANSVAMTPSGISKLVMGMHLYDKKYILQPLLHGLY